MMSPIKLTERIYLGYLVLFFLFFFIGWSIFPPFHNAAMQIAMWVFGLLCSLYAIKKTKTTITTVVFVFQLFFIIISTFVNAEYYKDLLGFNPQDADFYRSCGEDYGDKPFQTFIIWLAAVFPTIDDWGFPTIMWLVYKFFGVSWAPWVIRVLNAVVIAWGSSRLYSISCRFLNREESKVVALLWGLMPFAVHAGANGAKENFFVFFCISFFYFLYKCYEKRTVGNIFNLILYCGFLFLFRLATGYAAILCVLTLYFLSKRGVQKNFSFILISVVGIAVVAFPYVLSTIIQQRGYESDFFGARNDAKAEAVGGTIGFIINALSSFIGPIPCYISSNTDNLQFLTKYSFTPYVKLLTSFFFYYAFIDVIKNKRFGMMPMGVYSVINILILIIAFFGLHVRMHWPHWPFFLIITYWGYKQYATTKHKIPWYPLYLCFAFLLTFFYNFK